MSAIIVKNFNGLKPIVNAKLLEPSDAQVANNVRLVSGALVPMRNSTVLAATALPAPKTIYPYLGASAEAATWLEFAQDTDIMRSPVANDDYNRLYWTNGEGIPRYAPNTLILQAGTGPYPRASYQLGIPAPTTAISASAPAPGASVTPEYRTYVFTYVSAYGEEGPPSPASNEITMDPAGSATVSVPAGAPTGSFNITLKRIYRSSAAASGAKYQFVAEIPLATSSYVDSKNQGDLGEVLPSSDWVPPPAGLKGLRLIANGAAAGFKGSTLHLSEPNLPHAWPHEYPIDYSIVGIGAFGQNVAVLTDSYPYVFSGVDPAAMTSTRMPLPQACVSKRSIVETGSGVIYASADGLVEIGTSNDVITKNLYSRDQWQSFNPASMECYVHNGRIHINYDNGATKGLLVIDLSGQGAALTTSSINSASAITAAHYDARSDILYFAQGGSIKRFDAGSNLSMTWRSKKFHLDFPTNFSVAQVISAAYPVTLRVYADGVERLTRTVTNNSAFRLPSGFRSYDWEFQVEGTSEVHSVGIAQSALELKMS